VKLALCGGHSGVVSRHLAAGWNIWLHELLDKRGCADPRGVFMSWDWRLSLKQAELIEYFDDMTWAWGAASLPSTKDTPAVPWPTALTQPQGTGSLEEVKRVEKEKEVLTKALLLALGVQQQQAAPAPADYRVSRCVAVCVCVCVCVCSLSFGSSVTKAARSTRQMCGSGGASIPRRRNASHLLVN
jgi:hypothetical protein